MLATTTMVTETKKLGMGEISIPEFIKAYAANEDMGHMYLDAMSRWQNCFDIVEAYQLYGNDVSFFSTKLAKKILENGIDFYVQRETHYAKKAFRALLNLDRAYFNSTGCHFKGYVHCDTIDQIIEYLITCDDMYNTYMAGGHIEYQDR